MERPVASTHGILGGRLDRYLAALEYPDFRNMWFATMSAQAAAWALVVSRGWLVFDMTGSSLAVGIVTFATMAPSLIMPPIAGVLADRIDRRNLLASTYVINFFSNLALALLAWTGVLSEWSIIALSVVNGVARATQMSTSQALAANLVPQERLLNALSLSAATQHASRLIGPALVTPLLGFLGVTPAFMVCTVLYAVGWFQIMKVKKRTTGGIRKGESFFRSLGDGLAYTWSQPVIRMVMVMVFFHCGLTMAFESLLPNFAAHNLLGQHAAAVAAGAGALIHDHDAPIFDTDATAFATLMMGIGAGALIGSVYVGGIAGSLTRGRLYLLTGIGSGLGQVILSATDSMGMAVLACALMGASQAAFMTMGQALMQSLAADEFRGRIASLNTLSLGGVMSVMNLVNGALGVQYTAASILLLNGLLFASIMLGSAAFATPRRVYMRGMPGVRGLATA
ncbi:MAG: hypothetical protein QOF51_144 [Chloroflexota bacterium]|jgi:MFS family permease|nr:hypothetical protein [Chloroflexota bacterium]